MSGEATPPSPRPADGTRSTPAAARPPVDHVRENATSVTVLLETAHTRIEHFRRGGEGGTLVVTFDPILYLADRPPFGQEFLRKQALDVIAVRKKTENFYQPLSREQFDAVVGPVSARYARVVSYGSSLGAYAALYYGRDEPWTVIASSPRNSTHPVFGVDHWQERQRFLHERLDPARPVRCRAIILYDPCDPMDRRYLDGEVLPQFAATAEVLRVPYSGHPSNQFLHEIGFIAPFVRAVLSGETARRPKLDRRGKRRVSTTYHQVLATACLRHGHLAWAESLLERALELNPRNMLAHRTRGMVKLERRDWDGAITALEQALAIDPKDTSSLVLLKRARRSDAPPPAPPTPAPVAPPSLPRRTWRRLRRLLGLDPPPPGSR